MIFVSLYAGSGKHRNRTKCTKYRLCTPCVHLKVRKLLLGMSSNLDNSVFMQLGVVIMGGLQFIAQRTRRVYPLVGSGLGAVVTTHNPMIVGRLDQGILVRAR